ncbi:MAG: LD-carboxypeptidase [Verrucomicrobia bacterium]|nr:LD-carboxypeptidase [Cytophagales bacterium]
MPLFISPPPLLEGQTVLLVSTARKLALDDVKTAITLLGSWGLNVKLGKNLFSEANQFAGSDDQRGEDLQTALDDPDIAAIICARGGYGTSRILDKLNFSRFEQQPKWITGFSDITALHTHLHRLHLQSIHSTMPICFDTDETISVESLRKVLFGEKMSYEVPAHPLNRLGKTEGIIIGGNLSILANVIGTASDFDSEGKILFVEDTDEYLYHIDRMMVHLQRAGKLKNLAGLLVGVFTKMHDNGVSFGKDAEEIIADAVKNYDFPICFGFPTGHSPRNVALICGSQASLEVNEKEVKLSF